MPMRLTRRAFIALAGAALLVGGLASRRRVRAQTQWTLTADVVPIDHAFSLRVSFSVGFPLLEQLYIEVADADSPSLFFSWEPIAEFAGQVLFEVGPWGIPDGRPYLVTIVTPSSERHVLSPVVQVQVPSYPEILG
jgi:hypothetical protein